MVATRPSCFNVVEASDRRDYCCFDCVDVIVRPTIDLHSS